MKYYDTDGDGNITYEEFIRGLKEPLNARRSAMVKKAFNLMDKDGKGTITINEIAPVFNVSANADYQQGRKSKDDILRDFLSTFEGVRGDGNGEVTWAEFEDYYSDISLSIPDDNYFC